MVNSKDFIFRDLKYKIYSDGKVYSYSSDLYLTQRLSEDGYPTVTIGSKSCGRTSKKVHRLVAENFVSNDNGFLEVNHIDGNKQNNNFDNLEWCSRSYNVKHAFDMGLKVSSKGSKNGRAILKEKDIGEIRDLLACGFTRYEIAKMYGVSWSNINFIQKGKTWTHV